ncbi:MAG: hypothetical protein H8E35_10655 [Ardenticatenia bacterium]|nr:hypothetical protein [Ardenticatenia bacterium]
MTDHHTTESALEVYGSRGDIKELAQRIKLFLPNGDKLKEHEVLALSQISLAYALNAFNGEVFYLPGKGPMVGIKGLRKAARNQAGYVLQQRSMTDDERKERGMQDDAVGRVCYLYRVDIVALMPPPPIPFVGEGLATRGERPPSTKTHVWLADKRAEADALKKAFDLPFGYDERYGDNGSDHLPQIEVLPPAREPEMTAEEAADELFGEWATPAAQEDILAGEDDGSETNGEPEPDGNGDKPPAKAMTTNGRAVVTTNRWGRAIEHIHLKTNHYADKDGNPNPFHMMAAAAKEGYSKITDENIEAVVARLIARVDEKAAEAVG